jgi:hypothetical protein
MRALRRCIAQAGRRGCLVFIYSLLKLLVSLLSTGVLLRFVRRGKISREGISQSYFIPRRFIAGNNKGAAEACTIEKSGKILLKDVGDKKSEDVVWHTP